MDQCEAFGEFVHMQRPLYLLCFPVSVAGKHKAEMNRKPITSVELGEIVYMDLRRWGEVWNDQLELPRSYETLHAVECRYTGWEGKGQRKIKMDCELFSDVYFYGLERTLTPDMSFVDDQFALQHPEVLPDKPRKRTAILERLRRLANFALAGGGRR